MPSAQPTCGPDTSGALFVRESGAPPRVRAAPDRHPGPEQLRANIRRSAEIQAALWSKAEALAIAQPDFDAFGLYIESLNEVIDLSAARITAGSTARVPETVIWLLILGAT